MGFLIGIPINPDLSEQLLFHAKVLMSLLLLRYKAVIWEHKNQVYIAVTPGEQYRHHIRSGGYRP